MEPIRLDQTDRAILHRLQNDAWTPLSTIAQEIGVANATVHLRVSKLRELGVIREIHAEIDYRLAGFQISAFVGIILHKARDYRQVIKLLEKLPEVVEAYYATGNYNILCKVYVHDIDELHAFLMKTMQGITEIQSTQTLVILDAPIRRARSLYGE